MLWNLYTETYAELTRELTARTPLAGLQANPDMRRFLDGLPPRYLRTHDQEEIAGHLRLEREGRERGEDIVGFYHSHPDHPAHWSPTDLAEAHWIGCSYVITSVEQGIAAITNSFELIGSDEADKKLVDEKIEII